MTVEIGGQRELEGGGYEAPRLTIHGSLAEATTASLIGTVFDKSIPAGASVVSIFGGTSL